MGNIWTDGSREILLPEVIMDADERGSCRLTDPDSGMVVDLTQVPRYDCMVMQLPTNGAHPGRLVRNLRGIHRSCDYIVLIQRPESIVAILIEVKKCYRSGNGMKRAGGQLMCSEPVAHYLISLLQVHSNLPALDVELRHVVIAEQDSRRLDKQPVRKKSLGRAISCWPGMDRRSD